MSLIRDLALALRFLLELAVVVVVGWWGAGWPRRSSFGVSWASAHRSSWSSSGAQSSRPRHGLPFPAGYGN